MAGISGGADSVCLLFVLKNLCEELGMELIAVHVNHGIRGEEAMEDQRFVEKVWREDSDMFRQGSGAGESGETLGRRGGTDFSQTVFREDLQGRKGGQNRAGPSQG